MRRTFRATILLAVRAAAKVQATPRDRRGKGVATNGGCSRKSRQFRVVASDPGWSRGNLKLTVPVELVAM